MDEISICLDNLEKINDIIYQTKKRSLLNSKEQYHICIYSEAGQIIDEQKK
jgi:hypothetical protein